MPTSRRVDGRQGARPDRRSGPAREVGRPRQGPRLTGRTALLGLVVCVLVLSVAYPAHNLIQQRRQIAELEEAQASQRARISELESRKERWKDPEYVRTQARQRLQYVKPGEVAYVIVDDPNASRTDEQGGLVTGRADADGPWYGRLGSSVAAADEPATGTDR